MEIKGLNVAKKMLYSDTQVPDVFISQYISKMDSDYFKIYIYCLFLDGYNKSINENTVACGLNVDKNTVKDAFTYFVENGLATVNNNVLLINDIKDMEIKKYYTNETGNQTVKSITPEHDTVIRAINNEFFQGVMGITWYSDIGTWFEKFKFDTDVMYQLFHMCYERNALGNNSYISKVAEDWYNKNIKTDFDLQIYLKSRSKISMISDRITKQLRLRRNLTVYEEKLVEKWVNEYGYNFDVIEMALKNAANINNPNINYFDKIITNWHNNNLNELKQIEEFENTKVYKKGKTDIKNSKKPAQLENFTQRKYDKEFLESLYEEL